MKAKKALYAAVGAPMVGYREAADRVSELRTRFNKEADTLGKSATARFEKWAAEGEKLINRLSDAKVVDEFASRVDFDQVSTQVNKLRDQLEDLLATWRSSFRPEKLPTVKVEASTDGVKFETIPARKAAARKTTGQKATAKKTATGAKATAATKKTTARKTTARKSSGAKKATVAS